MAMEGADMPRLIVRHRSHSPVRCHRSHSPVRRASPGPTRRVPSSLENAQFRPVAMNYAASPTNPQSCKYFNRHINEEDEPLGAPGGFCSAVRTVGYSTVGGKSFMSGKCPHCKRMVKSDNQVCTPNATPPPSPWKVKLQSPLRSPLRSPKTPGGHATLQSPLRSPFKGSFFGKDADSGEDSSDKPTDISTQQPAKCPHKPSPVKNRPSARSSRTRSQFPPSASVSPRGRSPETNPSSRTPWRGRALTARSLSPVRSASQSSPVRAAGPSTRGPRSPGPRSPMHSPWKGAGFFEGTEGTDAVVTTECNSSSVSVAKSRGAHSPGPRSPLRVEVNFESVEEEDERREAKERSKAAQASNQHSENGWKIKSPLRSPFKGGFLSRVKNSDVAAPAESE